MNDIKCTKCGAILHKYEHLPICNTCKRKEQQTVYGAFPASLITGMPPAENKNVKM